MTNNGTSPIIATEGGDELSDNKYKDRATALFESFMRRKGLNYSKIAGDMTANGRSMSRQGIFKMVKNGSIKVSTLMEILDYYEMQMVIRKKPKRKSAVAKKGSQSYPTMSEDVR